MEEVHEDGPFTSDDIHTNSNKKNIDKNVYTELHAMYHSFHEGDKFPIWVLFINMD